MEINILLILAVTFSVVFGDGTKPVFEKDLESITARENSYLEIPCVAEGDLPITYEWYTEDENKVLENSNLSVYVSNRGKESVLIISTVKTSDAGMYICLASNTYGLSSKTFELKVEKEKDTTNNIGSFVSAGVVNVTATSVKFDINVTGTVEDIEVLYRENRSEIDIYEKFKYGENYEIKNLIPAGRYSFKFRTIPSKDGQWSSLHEVILLPDKPEVIFRAIDPTTGTVRVEWLFKFDDRMRYTIDRHEITYFTVQNVRGISWDPSKCAITIQIPDCTSSSYTITGLGRNVYYEIQLRAHTASGYGEPYKQKIFMPNRF